MESKPETHIDQILIEKRKILWKCGRSEASLEMRKASAQCGRVGKSELQSGNDQFGSNSTIFLAVRPWNLMDDLGKQKGISPLLFQALCNIS